MNYYVYCLSDEVTPAMVEKVAGVAGAEVVLVSFEEMTAVVSRFEGETVSVGRENVFAHERVVSHVLQQTTPLPFRFGTVVGAKRLERYVNSQRSFLLEALGRVRGCVEMSIKVIWDKEGVRHENVEFGQRSSATGVELDANRGPGATFLLEKRREILGDEILKERAAEIGSWFSECLNGIARESNVEVNPTQTLVVKAAHLVERERIEEYRERLQEMRRERRDLRFLTSGPWPPYSFSQVIS